MRRSVSSIQSCFTAIAEDPDSCGYACRVGFGNVGYPISPGVLARVPVAGVPTVVMIQAFERRVLTVAITGGPTSPLVEFGNIGQHYYQWRYAAPATAANLTSTPTLPSLPTLSALPAPPTAATPVAVTTPTAVAPTSSAFIGPAAIGPPGGATPTITFTTLTSPIAQGASATANIQTTPYYYSDTYHFGRFQRQYGRSLTVFGWPSGRQYGRRSVAVVPTPIVRLRRYIRA